jgi:hypothetical protein
MLRRLRFSATAGSSAWGSAVEVRVPRFGRIVRVVVTLDESVDEDADAGLTPATDLGVRVYGSSLGLGAADASGTLLVYARTPATPTLTLDAAEDLPYALPPQDDNLAEGAMHVQIIAGPSGTAGSRVATAQGVIEIEESDAVIRGESLL